MEREKSDDLWLAAPSGAIEHTKGAAELHRMIRTPGWLGSSALECEFVLPIPGVPAWKRHFLHCRLPLNITSRLAGILPRRSGADNRAQQRRAGQIARGGLRRCAKSAHKFHDYWEKKRQ